MSLKEKQDSPTAITTTGTKRQSTSGIKILNDEKILTPSPVKIPVMTSVPLSPPKQITLSIAKPKVMKQNNMDHYVLKTFKGEQNAEGLEEGETIDFVLTENNEEDQQTKCSGEITEELHLSDDDQDSTFTGSTHEIVEHVCGKCYKTFRRLKVRDYSIENYGQL